MSRPIVTLPGLAFVELFEAGVEPENPISSPAG